MGAYGTGSSRIVVLIDGGANDEPLIEMACLLAKRRGAQVFLLRIVLVERWLPLDADLPEVTARAQAVLERAKRSAAEIGCTAEIRELRTRDVAAALVDEAADLGCDQIILAPSAEKRGGVSALAVVEHVVRLAPCAVWVYWPLEQR